MKPALSVALLGCSLLLACQTPTASLSQPATAAAISTDRAVIPAGVAYAIIPEASELRLLVYRAGPLARLGHNHVIRSNDLQGDIVVAEDLRQSQFRLRIPVAAFRVDEPQARQEEGQEFAILPDDEAIAGTTRNMLGERVLDAGRYPEIRIESLALSGPDWGLDATLHITLHGVSRIQTIPVAIEREGKTLHATALFTIRQREFGITPLSVLGGGLSVDDAVRVRLRLVARQQD
ncbi:YceI family protein [Chitinilyticum piscinae]|uniref:YceI family protein n=1 Tax=Chitinilyticum piscinae TaxID=2866724 RepID=A0A8J7FL60_9NEIS|nr:YceI family protein [Chitinilyticum piscinae]MBE9610082.1 YceI family protein [Chitinilyticum piscinae]